MTIELDAQKLSVQPTACPRSTVSIGRPAFRVAVAGDAVAQGFPIVVRRETLRDAQRARSLVRAGSHDQANFVVALEVEVAVASDAASARASAARAQVAAGGGSSNPAGGGSVTSVVGGSTPRRAPSAMSGPPTACSRCCATSMPRRSPTRSSSCRSTGTRRNGGSGNRSCRFWRISDTGSREGSGRRSR